MEEPATLERNCALRRLTAVALFVLLLAVGPPAEADRAVLAPRGVVLSPGALRAEYQVRVDRDRDRIGWLALGLPEESLGIELEAERNEFFGRKQTSLSAQYSLTGNAFLSHAPAFSVGVRDITRSGRERQALWAAATAQIPLPVGGVLLENLRVTAGYGTSRLGGGYLAAETRMLLGPAFAVEYVNRRVNASVGLTLLRILELKASSLDGRVTYGAAITVRR